MIDPEALRRWAIQSHTTEVNAAREYFQHLFLSAFYPHRTADRILFKGGTALRIIYGSPRFSEDLDFSGFGIRAPAIEETLAETLSAIERAGLRVEIEEAKATTGGYLGILHGRFLDYRLTIQLEISLRNRGRPAPATALIASDLLPAYTLLHLPQELLVEEKLQALLARSKPRDFLDLYFLLRKGMLPPKSRPILTQGMARLRQMPPESFRDLRLFLPKDQQGIAKGFRATLERELQRYLIRPIP